MRYIIVLLAIPILVMIGWYYGSTGMLWYEFLLLILTPIAIGLISGLIRSERRTHRRGEFGEKNL